MVPTVREALRQAREDKGMTQEQAAHAAGYKAKSSWAMVELGYNTPSAQQMKAIAEVVSKRASEVFKELREDGDDHDQSA